MLGPGGDEGEIARCEGLPLGSVGGDDGAVAGQGVDYRVLLWGGGKSVRRVEERRGGRGKRKRKRKRKREGGRAAVVVDGGGRVGMRNHY